ncbi:unnamed protein product [Closterium sp. NIES-64]|nr:unnamed protein product [Closterium sp. NIES-64]
MAGTALSRQLRQIALSTGPTAADVVTKSSGKRGAHIRPSLIFEAKEAADVDAETILHMAQAGLAELVAMDARFKPFLSTLFSPATLQTDRDDEPPDVVAALDRSIDAFLMLLSDALLLPASHKPLEYLIRKYRVQQCNVDSLVLAALPYHETSLFVRIVQLLSLKHSKWAPVLHGCKANGAAIPRAQLVQRCVKDDSFFHAMCHAAEKAATCVVRDSPASASPPTAPAAPAMRLLTFTSVLLLEALAAMRVSVDALSHLLPFILNGLQPSAVHEHRVFLLPLSPLTVHLLSPPCHAALNPECQVSCASSAQHKMHGVAAIQSIPLLRMTSYPLPTHLSPPHQLAAMMLVSQLANRSQLSTQVVNSLLVALLSPTAAAACAAPTARGMRAPPTAISMDAFLVVVHLCAVSALAHLLSHPLSCAPHPIGALVSSHRGSCLIPSGLLSHPIGALVSSHRGSCLIPSGLLSQAVTNILADKYVQSNGASVMPALHPSFPQKPLSLAVPPQRPWVRCRHFVDVLSTAAHKFNTAKILNLLADTLLPKIATSQAAADVLLAMLRQLPRAALSPLVPRLALSLLRFAVGKGLPQGAPVVLSSLQPRIQPLLLALSLKFTSPTDAAIAAVLESLASAPAERATLVSFLGTALSASPCALQQVDAPPAATGTGVQQQQQQQKQQQQQQQQQQLLSVHLAIDHAQWQVRKAAVEQLPALMAAAGKHTDTDEAAQGEVQSFVSSALQRRLADDSWEVLHAAVTSPLLPRALSASLLFAPLKAILLRPLPPASEPLPAHIKECQSTALHLLRTAVMGPALKTHPGEGQGQGSEEKEEWGAGGLVVQGVAEEVMPHVLLSALMPSQPYCPSSPLANPQMLHEALLMAQQLAPHFPLFLHLPSPSLASLSLPSFSASDALSLVTFALAVAITPPSLCSAQRSASKDMWRTAIRFSRSAFASSSPAGRQLLLLALLGAAHSLPATSASLESALQSRENVAVAGSTELQEAKEGGVMEFAEEVVGLVQDAWKAVVAQAVHGSGGEGEKRRKGAASVHLDALLSSLAQVLPWPFHVSGHSLPLVAFSCFLAWIEEHSSNFSFSPACRPHSQQLRTCTAKIFTLLSTLPASSIDSLSLSADLTVSCLSSLLRKLPGATRISDSVSGPRKQQGVVAGRVFELLMGTASPKAAALAAARIAGAVQGRAKTQGGKSDGEGGGRVEYQEAMLEAVRDMGLRAGETAGGEEGSTGQQGIASLLQLLLARFTTRASLLTFLDPFLLPSPSRVSHSPSLQLAALSLLPAVAAAAVPGDAKANEELPHVLLGALLRLMVAVQSPHKPVRKAALHAFATLTQATATLPSSSSTLPSPSSLSLLAYTFSSSKDALLSDPSLPLALSSSSSSSSTVALSLPAFTRAASSTTIPSKPCQAAALLIRLLDPSCAASTGSSLTPSDRTVLLSALFNAAISLPPWPQALALHMLAAIPAATALLPLGLLLPRLHELLSRRLHYHLQQAQGAAGPPLPHKPASVDPAARLGGRLELDEVHLLAVGLQLVAAAASGGGQEGVLAEADVDEEMREEGGEGEESAKHGKEKAQHTAGKGVAAVDVAPLLLMAMQVQGAMSADDVAVEAPSITAAGVVTDDFLEALPDTYQDGLVASLLFLMAASEASPAARQAAKEALRRLKLSPTMLARLVTALFSPPSVSHGAPQATSSNTPDIGGYVPLSDSLPVERRVATATGLLEMLLWKEDVTAQQTIQLFPSLATTISSVLSHRWPMLPAPNSNDAEEEGGEQGGQQAEDGEGDVAGSEVAMSAQMLGAVEFVLQLVLTVARNALSSHTHMQEGQDEAMESEGEEDEEGMEHGEEECVVHMVGAAVEVVKGRRDPATASAAIAVLAAAAERQPEEVVEHVVAVLSVATTTTLALDIRESHDAIHRLVEAVLPAWLHHNQDVTPLLQMVVSSLPSMLHHHRIALLTALLRGVSPSLGLAPLLLLLLTTTGVTPSLLTARADNSKDTPRSARARRQAALQQHAYWRRRGDSTGDEKQGEWGLSLAFELCSQVPGSIRLEAYVKLLEATCPPIIARRKASAAADEACDWWSGTGPNDDVVVVSFVGAELPAAVAAMEEELGMEGSADPAEGGEGGLNNEGDAAMVDTQHRQLFVSLLEHVVLRLRATAAAAAASAAVSPPLTTASYPPALKDRADLVASAAYELLQTLDDVTPSGVFLQAVQTLLTNPSTHIRRKVLRLLAARVRASAPHTLMPHGRGKGRSKQRLAQAAQEEAREYASVAGQLAHMGALEGADRSLATQMAALQTLDAIIKRFASLASEDFSPALAPLIRIISAHSSPPLLNAAALRCLSSLASSLHHLLLPHLPVLMPPLFASADRALAAAGNGAVEEFGADEGGAEDADEQMEEGEGHGRAEVVSEGVAHDLLAAVLQALEAMLAAMGPLLSPFTPRILACTCLSPVLLCCPSTSVMQHAHAVRQLLIQKLPMRLLLDPLVSSWSTATAAGPAPSAALLHMLARAASHMDRAAASTFHARIFDFLLLRTFDVRRAPPFPPSTDSSSNQRLPGGTQMVTAPDVEGASVAAMVGLVMKTSESVFKPMFVRVLEWAASEYAANGDAISPAGRVERHLTLFGLVNVLSDKLRSVFVPYFQYLFDIAIRHLVGTIDAAKGGMKKKRRKSASVAAAAEDSIAQWQLRHLVVCALHKCFIYDSNAAFLDATRFQALLEPLTSQIDREPPAGVASIVSAPSAPEAVSAASQLSEAHLMLEPYIAVSVPSISAVDDELVTCLGEMTIAGGSDILWKQLNHQVLMCTRSERVRSRQLSLRVVNEIVDRVREEYVVLLPESIPFLAELLEDSDANVAESAKSLVKKLEELSGEELTQYF